MPNKKKTVCFLLPSVTDMGGATKATFTVAGKMVSDYNVHIIGIFDFHDDAPYFSLHEGISRESFGLKRNRIRCLIIELYLKLNTYIRERNVDIVFTVASYAGMLASLASVLCRTHFVFIDHGALINEWDSKDIRLFRALAAYTHKRTIVLTEQSLSDYTRLLHLQRKKLSVIPNWIDSKANIDNLPYDSESKKIIWAGRLDQEKGFDLLLQIAEVVFDDSRSHGWTWDVYGKSVLDEPTDTDNPITRNHLGGKLRLMGATDQLYDLYPHYSIGTLTSYREGLPLFLLEAKAYRIPCISFDVPTGPSEIIHNEEDGILVPPYDVKAYAASLLRLMSSQSLRKSMSASSEKNIISFSEDAVYAKWVALIESL